MTVREPMNHLRCRRTDTPASRGPLAPSAGRRRCIPGSPVLDPPTSTCHQNTGIPICPRHQLRAPLLAGVEEFQASAEPGQSPGGLLQRSTDRWCHHLQQKHVIVIEASRYRYLLQAASRGRWDLTNPGLLLLNHMSIHLLTSPADPTCWVWDKNIAAACWRIVG